MTIKRGEIYRLELSNTVDPRRSRAFVIVSRNELLASSYSSCICAPIYTNRNGLVSEVEVGPAEGLAHDSAIRCDELLTIPKVRFTRFVGELGPRKLEELRTALLMALEIED